MRMPSPFASFSIVDILGSDFPLTISYIDVAGRLVMYEIWRMLKLRFFDISFNSIFISLVYLYILLLDVVIYGFNHHSAK